MIRNVPRDQWLYNDRGMMKWLGYFLSDHTQDMTDKKISEVPTTRLPQQDPEVIDHFLQLSWENSREIILQLNGEAYLSVYNIDGIVIGANDHLIYFQTDKTVTINVSDIRHAEFKKGSHAY
ncbi:hypothetical protein KTE19_11495 [Lentilactobacillus sp. IMAU92037]|uniref:hypothetical protein n=1 Tax=Lentilactobacillus TaxID=2767893 RepID=UPI001C275060|nr:MULTISPECIES: hypothetical protein [Lentilactobacillus]MBU9788812.1 hypothetical protein [Lentilactobacillus dabitei]MBV0931310.1 hypothetical protein [Lentilactobacillus dabitei]MDM7517390.1 hypothetical protein [Lentilactobacillus sp. TOM.63]